MKRDTEILILILADLGTDHRCHRMAATLKRLGYVPVILCDRPAVPLGPAWDGFSIRILTRRPHSQGFLRAFVPFLLRMTAVLLTTRSRTWIAADGPPLLPAALIGRLRGRRVLYDAREILEETPAIRDRPTRRLAWVPWLRAGTALASALITVSPLFERRFRRLLPGKAIALIPNVPAARPGRPEAKPPPGPRVRLIYQGALRKGSGLVQALHALEWAPEYDLAIYGAGPEEPLLRDLIARLGLGGRARLMGAVPFEALAAPLAEAHVGLHLLEPRGASFDLTLSNKIFDYIHALTPPLLSATTAHRHLLEQDPVGAAVPLPLETEGILAGLRALRATWDERIAACRAARGKWTWEAFEPALGDIVAGPGREGRRAGKPAR